MYELAPPASLWLEVLLTDRNWLFELKSGDDRAIVVGSDINSDVLIVRPGVGSTHFHFERAGDAILLVPGYRAALRVNSVRAVEPVALPARATIELLNFSIEVVTHTEKPEHLRITEPPPSPSRLFAREYLENLPNDTDPTGFTLAPTSSITCRPDFDTVEAPRPTFDTEPLPRVAFDLDLDLDREPELPPTPVAVASRTPAALGPLGPQGTLMLVVPNLGEGTSAAPTLSITNTSRTTTERLPRPQVGAVADARHPVRSAAPFVSRTTELEVPRAPRWENPTLANELTSIEVPAAHRVLTSNQAHALVAPPSASPSSAPMVPAAVPRGPLPSSSIGPLAAERTADFDVSAVASLLVTPPTGTLPPPSRGGPTPSTSPVTSTPPRSAAAPAHSERKPRARVMAYVALLGTVAQRRPLAVGAVATVGAALLTLALVGAARFAAPSVSAATSPRAAAATAAQLNSATSTLGPLAAAAPNAQLPPILAPTATEPAPSAADVAAAAGHLLAGRLQEAANAYEQLAAHDPSNPTYAAISRMLAERASPRCSVAPMPSGCPEVLP